MEYEDLENLFIEFETPKKNSLAYITIYDFMMEDMGLSGNDLLIYALIFSYTVNKKYFTASIGSIQKRFNIKSNKTVSEILKKLTNAGYISKEKVATPLGYCCKYKALYIPKGFFKKKRVNRTAAAAYKYNEEKK